MIVKNLLIYLKKDKIIPYNHGFNLYNNLHNINKEILSLENGTHHNILNFNEVKNKVIKYFSNLKNNFMKKIIRDFFKYDSEIVAKNILGKIIKVGNKKGIILETECYKGDCDKASHAYGKKTLRNSLMYDTFGNVYAYLIYGMYYCLNFTTDEQKPGAILIRNIKDIETGKYYDGPGKLTKFLGIDKTFNGEDLEISDKIAIYDDNIKIKDIEETTRIGIKKDADKLWRFVGKL